MKESFDPVNPVDADRSLEPAARVLDVLSVYSAACDLRAFTGPVSTQQLRKMLTRAGLDRRWLDGERWEALDTLWRAHATPSQAAAVFARFDS